MVSVFEDDVDDGTWSTGRENWFDPENGDEERREGSCCC